MGIGKVLGNGERPLTGTRGLRRALAALLVAGLALSGVVLTSASASAVTTTATYVSSSDGVTTSEVTATVLELPVALNSLDTGWYVCNNTLSTSNRLTTSNAASVNLILADNCNLTINSGAEPFGVPSGAALAIWSGINNTGRLSLNATSNDSPGLGKGLGDIGNITIRGGSITAIATGMRAPGIGNGIASAGGGSISIEWRANVDARGANANGLDTYYTAGAGIGSGGAISTTGAATNAPPITISTSGLVRATGGAGNGTKPAAPNIGNGSSTTTAGSVSISTATVSNPTVTGTGTVQMLNVNQTAVASANVTNVARGSSVTYLATPGTGMKVKSAIGNGVNMIKGSTSGTTTQYRHAVSVVPPATQATSFEFEPDILLALTASPVSPQTRPGDVTLTATLTTAGQPLANKTISFLVDGTTQPVIGNTDNDGVATFTVTSPLAGTHTFGAAFAGDGSYAAVNATDITGYVVQRATQTVTLDGVGTSYIYGDTPAAISASSEGSGLFTLTSSAPTVASLADAGNGTGTLTLERAGTFTLTAARAQDDTYNAASTTSPTATLSAATSVVTLTRSGGDTTTDPVSLSAVVNKRGIGETPAGTVEFFLDSVSQGTVTLAPNGNGDAAASLPDFTVPTFGSHTVSVQFSGDTGRYTPGSDSDTWSMDRSDQSTLAITNPGTLTFGDDVFTLLTTGGSGTGLVTWELLSDPGVISLNTSTGVASIIGAGEVSVRATKAADNTYNEATATRTFTVLPFHLSGVTAQLTGAPFTYQASQITPAATASFTGADTVSHTLVPGTDFTLSYGANLLVATGGTATLHANSANYTGSKDVSFTIAKAQPTLTLAGTKNGSAVSSPLALPGSFAVQTSFGGQGTDLDLKAIEFTQTAGPASLDLGTGKMTAANGIALSSATTNPAAGSYSFAASFAGDANYLAATGTLTSFQVVRGTQSISIAGVSANQTYGDGPLTLSLDGKLGTGASTFTSSDPTVASVSGATLTILKAGTFTLSATVAQDDLYAAANAPDLTVTVAVATPSISLTSTGGSTTAEPIELYATVLRPTGTSQSIFGETISFYEGATLVGTGTLNAISQAHVTISSPTRGEHIYTAVFAGLTSFYAPVTSDPLTVTVAGQPQANFAIVAPSTAEVVYGQPAFTLGLDGKLGTGAVTWSVPGGNGVVNIDPATGTITSLAVGTVTVTAQLAADPVYAAATATYALSITKRAVTVTPDPQTMVFGAATPTLTWTPQPALVGSDTLAGSLKLGGTIAVGEVAIVQDTPFSNPNYQVTFQAGVLTVTPNSAQQQVIDEITELPTPPTSSEDADKVADATNNYNDLSDEDRNALPQDVVDALKDAQDAAGEVNHRDEESGVSVEGTDDGAGGSTLPWYVRLQVTVVPSTDTRFTDFDSALTSPQQLLSLYDIRYINTLTGAAWQPAVGDNIAVTFSRVPSTGYSDFAVAYQPDGGTPTGLPSTVSEGVIRFETDQVGLFGAAAVSDQVQSVIDEINALPRPVSNQDDADQVAEATNNFDNLSPDEQALVPQEVIDRLHEAQEQAGDANHRDDENGVVAGGDALPWYVRIVVVRVPESDARFGSFESRLNAGRSLIELYDIHLVNTLTGERWQPPLGRTVEIALSKVSLSGFSSIGIAHELVSGEIEVLPSQLDGTIISFEGASFSLYGVTGVRDALPNTGAGDNAAAVFGAAALLAGGWVLIAAARRRKSTR